MLHDPLRSALRLPTGSRAGLLPAADLCRTASSQLRRSQPGQLRRPGSGRAEWNRTGT